MTTFITTAIPYVNARPHLGFAYELVLADILSRHRKRRGGAVRFTTGTDDNSLKNVRAAAREDVTPRALVDRNATAFAALGPLLDVAADDFIRTSTDPRHLANVDHLWRACAADLYKATWRGRYCEGCEAFVDDTIAICAEHGTVPEEIDEENWFFRLSSYRDRLREAIETHRITIVPDAARTETLAFLSGEVRDLCVSRAASRSRGWGIPVPDDPSQVIYVWFDALANYLVGDWRSHEQRTHVIGKGITRFHAAYWPAFLLSARLPLPDRIAVHGYLTVDGVKISKSGIGADVPPIVERTGVDALRWFYARRCRTRTDSDVTVAAIIDAHDRDLVGRLGNLVQRCRALIDRVPPRTDHPELRVIAEALPARVDAALDAFLFDDAVAAIIELIDAANRALEISAPWKLRRTDPDAAAAALYAPLEAARFAAGELAPFVPTIAQTIATALGAPSLSPHWGLLAPGTPLPAGSQAVIPRRR